MTAFSWLVSVLVVGLLASFVAYLVSLRRLPTARRTDIRVFDRLGRVQDVKEADEPRRK